MGIEWKSSTNIMYVYFMYSFRVQGSRILSIIDCDRVNLASWRKLSSYSVNPNNQIQGYKRAQDIPT